MLRTEYEELYKRTHLKLLLEVQSQLSNNKIGWKLLVASLICFVSWKLIRTKLLRR